MPKLELTMDQWGLVLDAVRDSMNTYRNLKTDVDKEALSELAIAEDRIIDMAFNLAKETEDTNASKKDDEKPQKFECPVGQKL